MKTILYSQLNSMLNINEEYESKFRNQNNLERTNLKSDLLYHKRVLTPLKVKLTASGYTLIDGHHRWELLPEVIKECPDFDTAIPVVVIKEQDVDQVMLRTQLGRRNLSIGEIAKYVTSLRQDGLTKGQAIKQAAQDMEVSTNKVKNAVYEGRADKARDYSKIRYEELKLENTKESLPISARKPPQSTETSLDITLDKPPIKPVKEKEYNRRSLVSKEEENAPRDSNFVDSLYEMQEDGTEVFTPVKSSFELERLENIKDSIEDLTAALPFFQDYPLYDDLFTLVTNYQARLKLLSK